MLFGGSARNAPAGGIEGLCGLIDGIDQPTAQRISRFEYPRLSAQIGANVQLFGCALCCPLGNDSGVKVQIPVEAHCVFGDASMIDGTVQVPMEGVKQKLAVQTSRPTLSGQEDDITHRLDRPQVMGMHGYRERAQEII